MKSTTSQQAVLSLVSRRTSIPTSKLSLDDRLLQDLGIDGDDACELLVALSREFGVDLNLLVFEKYFGSEPTLFSVFRRPRAIRKDLAEKVPVRIRDLVSAVDTGKWPL